MRIDYDLALCGANLELPEAVETTADAVRLGRIAARAADQLGVRAVHVADPESLPADLAVTAAVRALSAAGQSALDVGLLLHTHVWHQGHDLWSAPHYLAHRIGAHQAFPMTLSQNCNAVMAAIELSVPWLAMAPRDTSVLITAADQFCPPAFDRWRCAYGCVYGDGATAAVLRRGPVPGALAVRAISSKAAPELEEVNRAGQRPTPAPRMHDETVDLRGPKKAYFQRHGISQFQKTTEAAVRDVVLASLADAGVAPDDPRIRAIAVPRLSATIIDDLYKELLATLTPAPVLSLQAQTGHLSCGDVTANVADLHREALLRPGDLGIVLNVGGGYTWSSLVVEVPGW